MTDQQQQVAMIELVDSDIRCADARELTNAIETPGYALVTSGGVISGQEALRRAWLEPQRCFNQFWHQLNLAPLPLSSRHARHYADLAYAQLQDIYRETGEPQQVLFAVPGSFSRDQLAILLGLVKALPFNAIGLVDSAVAALSNSRVTGRILHVECQLHQSLLTVLELGESVNRLQVEPVAETGIRHFHDIWSQHIANLFIREYRYDPLHTAEGEQQLQDNLPTWLRQLASEPETDIQLTTARGNFRLKLNRRALLATTERQMSRLAEAKASLGNFAGVYVSHRLASLPGLADSLDGEILAADACLRGCQIGLSEICRPGEALQHITRLSLAAEGSVGDQPAFPSKAISGRPTHLLQGYRSWPIGEGLGVSLDNDAPVISASTNAEARLSYSGDKLHLHSGNPRIRTDSTGNLMPGDRIYCGNTELLLIEEQQSR